jgi:hypothetical protein
MYYCSIIYDTEAVVDKVMDLIDGYLAHRWTTLAEHPLSNVGLAAQLINRPTRISILITFTDKDGTEVSTLQAIHDMPFVMMKIVPAGKEPPSED